VIEEIDSLESTQVTNSQVFAFFKGFNVAAVNGILSADVPGGLPAGVYKVRLPCLDSSEGFRRLTDGARSVRLVDVFH
jgi:hypothetical protein